MSGLTSSADLSSVSGRIVVTGRRGPALGRIDGRRDRRARQRSLVRLKRAGGTIVLRGEVTDASLSTVSGAATAQLAGLDRGRMETVGGHLTFEAGLRPGGNYTIESHSGDISIRLPASFDAALDLTALEGRVVNRLTKSPVQPTEPAAGARGSTALGRQGDRRPRGPDLQGHDHPGASNQTVGVGIEGGTSSTPVPPFGRHRHANPTASHRPRPDRRRRSPAPPPLPTPARPGSRSSCPPTRSTATTRGRLSAGAHLSPPRRRWSRRSVGRAEGMVNGRRQTITLTFTDTSRDHRARAAQESGRTAAPGCW